MRRCLSVLVLSAAAAVLLPPSGASALTLTPCKAQPGFECGVVRVPLDRTGALPGTIDLRIAAARRRAGDKGILLALSGGPGQSAVSAADSFALSLKPALGDRRLVVLDQRGTGGSGALRCPRLQASGLLDPVSAGAVAACAASIGPGRVAYGSTDTARDLDAVREALGAPRMALMGVSYGTYVATQYARLFPDRVDWLVLDSVVGADGVNPYLLESLSAMRRVLAEQCAGTRCRLATTDALADLAALLARVREGPLGGTRFDARGRSVRTALRSEQELFLLLLAGDLNPYLSAALPGAVNAALGGDPAPLLRLRRIAGGAPTPTRELSVGLNVTTTCADSRLPYSFTAPIAERTALWQSGLAVGDDAFAPFSRAAVLSLATAHDCLLWPEGDVLHGPSSNPLPDVPALLLAGRQDLRTPLENARTLAAALPRATVVPVSGTGHDILDADLTGCAATALRRFAAGAPVGSPCRGRTNAVAPFARPARSLADYRRAPGVAGRRGQELFAVLDTIQDAQVTAVQRLYAGYRARDGGGLRGGWFRVDLERGRFVLRRYSAVPGLRVSGTLGAGAGSGLRGSLRIEGPGSLDGRLVLGSGDRVSGTLGGRTVAYRPRRGAAGTAAGIGAGRAADRRRLPDLRAAAQQVRALRAVAGR